MNTANILALNAVSVPNTHPAYATFYAAWASQLNANWGQGALTVTPFNSAAVAASVLNLTGSTNKRVTFDPVANADSTETGTIDCVFTPNYAGTPANPQVIINISQALNSNVNLLNVVHYSDGNLYFQIYDNTGTRQVLLIYAFAPTAHTAYRITARFNGAGGANANTLAVAGVVVATDGTAFTRSGAIAYGVVGDFYQTGLNGANADFSISDLAYYSQSVVVPVSPVLNPNPDPVVASSAVDARFVLSATAQATFTDAGATGILKLQASNDPQTSPQVPPTNWSDVPGTVTTVTNGALTMTPILAPNFCYQWIRAMYLPTSGDGTITAYLHTMGA